MRFEFENNDLFNPKVSILLLDWSCRESFHTLHYLNSQTIAREKYEVIWIEYFERKAPDIDTMLEESCKSGRRPILDQWIIMDMPERIYYHKHLMYNLGIIAGKGEIFTICDSDAVVNPTFVESIITSFEGENNIVLHMDELRNIEKKFYPFSYPPIEEIAATKCLNSVNGKPRGLVDRSAFLHLPNYGACFSALKKDLIAIGGADEHIDFLGHICGPYDMTFRLVNAGNKERWHPEEWLFHTWHPGQSGDNNFAGPHDGRHMSQTALSTRKTGRVLPLVENQAIKTLRVEKEKSISKKALLQLALSSAETHKWHIIDSEYGRTRYWLGHRKIKVRERESIAQQSMKNLRKEPRILLRMAKPLIFLFMSELWEKMLAFKKNRLAKEQRTRHSTQGDIASLSQEPQNFGRLIHSGLRFLKRLLLHDSYIIGRCLQCLHDLKSIGVREVALLGTGPLSQVISLLSPKYSIKVRALYASRAENLKDRNVHPLHALRDYRGKIVIASFDDVEKKTEMLKEIGIKTNMIFDLW